MANPAVLVTRPLHQGQALTKRLEALGCRTVHVPVLAVESITEADFAQAPFAQLGDFDALVVVSLNAAQVALPWLNRHPDLHPALFAVGVSTARYLEQECLWCRHQRVLYPDRHMNSEGLLALPELQAERIRGKRFLILRGEGGREHIAHVLREREAHVENGVLYRRYCPHQYADALRSALAECDTVTINSVESLRNFMTLAQGSPCTHKTIVVPGDRVAEAGREFGFRHIIVADNATDSAMVRAICPGSTDPV